ncbi:unnamed protein product [Diamesa serratosioi]
MEFRVLIIVIVLIAGGADANRTKAVRDKVNCGLNGLLNSFKKPAEFNTNVANGNYSIVATKLKEFGSTVIPCITEFLQKHPNEDLSAFLQTLKASLEKSTLDIQQIHLPNVPKLINEFYYNFTQFENKSISCRFNSFLETVNKTEKAAHGCYISKFLRNFKKLTRALRKINRQTTIQPREQFYVFMKDIVDKLQKWLNDICDGLNKCANATNIDCCVKEFLWANGTVILRDTNVTDKIYNTVSSIILDFVAPPATVTKLIGENYEKLDKDLKCCEVF